MDRDAPVIAFTYNEPTVFIEYLTDIARAAQAARPALRARQLRLHERGAARARCASVLDAIKIDLKGFSEDFYRDVCGAELKPVLRSIRQVAKSGVHLEIVNLVVPTLNDSARDADRAGEVGRGRAGPRRAGALHALPPRLPAAATCPPTPVATLERAREIGMAQGLHYAYVGNVPGHPGNHTYCPGCGTTVIERDGLFVTAMRLRDGRCPKCRRAIPGVWS